MRYFLLSSPGKIHFLFLCLLLSLRIPFRPSPLHALSLDTGFQVTQGEVGSEENTTYASASFHIQGKPFPIVVAELTIPYIYQKGGGVISVGGQTFAGANGQGFGAPARNQYGGCRNTRVLLRDQAGEGSGLGGSPSGGGNPPDGVADKAAQNACIENNNEAVQGIGDIHLSLSSDVQGLVPYLPRIIPIPDLYAGLKIPTADSHNGLGTGEYDYTLGLTLSWKAGSMGWYLSGDYTWVGDTGDTDFKNLTCYGGGADYDLSPKTAIMVDLSRCSALYTGGSPHSSLQLGIKREIGDTYWVRAYGVSGLNAGSADYGFGLTVGMDI